MDSQTDIHRHLSHLIGVSTPYSSYSTDSEEYQLYPGYAIASYDPLSQGGLWVNGMFLNYTKEQVLTAAETSLLYRGNGTGPDGDAGWEKIWRAASWAQLGNVIEYYKELTVRAPSAFNSVF